MSSSLRSLTVPALAATLAAVTALSWRRAAPALRGLPRALGASTGRVRRSLGSQSDSDHHAGSTFHNRQPSHTLGPGDVPALVRALRQRGAIGSPRGTVEVLTPRPVSAPADLAVTWLGHASVLAEVDGVRLLFDPVVQERVSPSPAVGPRRLHAAPLRADELPEVAAVVISHDHYDHLEDTTIRALAARTGCRFVVPLGVGAHLRRWGVPAGRIDELDWDSSVDVQGLQLTCTEARHFSGRFLRRDVTLWSSWAVRGPRHRVFFGGDTGYTPSFARTGARYGPFDLTILPIGAYHPAWRDIHLDPEEALRAHGDLGGGALLPIHWATFDLALHAWDEPVERLLRAAATTTGDPVVIATPLPGARWDVAGTPPQDRWWRPLAPSVGGENPATESGSLG